MSLMSGEGMKRDYGYDNCARCGKPFKKKSANSKYCNSCKPFHEIERRKERYEQAASVTRYCIHCGGPFKSKSGRGAYCSKCREDITRVHILESLGGCFAKRKRDAISREDAYVNLLVAMMKGCPGPTEESCETCFFDTTCLKQRELDVTHCARGKILNVG